VAVGRLLREHSSPARLGWSVGLGAAIACTPFFGLQTLLALGLAWLFRLNRVAAITGAQLSTPPLSPVLIFVAVQLGARLTTGRFLLLGIVDFQGPAALDRAATLLGAWLLGGLVLGAAVGAALGLVTYAVARSRATPAAASLAAARRRAAARYREAPARDRHYARWKYRLDPGYDLAAAALAEHAGPAAARVCDLGCGLGLLTLLLKEAGAQAAITAVDWDPRKLAVARAAAAGLAGVDFTEQDLTRVAPPACDAAALIDVLHYLPPAIQDEVLARVAAALTPGGRLVVREADRARGLGLGRTLERLGTWLGWHRTAGEFHYRRAADLTVRLEALGLAVRLRAARSWLHPANVLLVADKPG
jgi:uncharacterized protein (DUF2062 family)/precorrin-6B methylase 2